MAKNMTEGNSLKLILSFAAPLLFGNLLQQTYNLADAAIVGKYLGAKALAAVGASTSVQFMTLGFCIGICCGFAIPVAQKFGAGDYKEMRRSIFHGIVLTVLFGVVLTLACTLLCSPILHMMQTSDTIFANAYIYLLIIFLGIPFNLLYNFLAGILRAVGDSKTPFNFLIVSTFLNIILDVVCIMVFQWGCAGAAIATVASQAVSGILCLIYIIKKYDMLKIQPDERKWDGRYGGKIALLGIPMGLQYSITAIGTMVMQSANNGLGDLYTSAFAAGSRIKQFAMCPFDAVATGVSTFASQNYGAGKYERIKKGIKQGMAIGVSYGIFIGIILIFFGRTLSLLFLSSKEVAVLDATAQYLRCIGFFYWSLGILNICRMTTQGLGYSGRAIISGIVEMVARCIVCFGFVPVYKFTAICFSDQTAWVTAAIYSYFTCMYCVKKITRDNKGKAPVT